MQRDRRKGQDDAARARLPIKDSAPIVGVFCDRLVIVGVAIVVLIIIRVITMLTLAQRGVVQLEAESCVQNRRAGFLWV